MQFDKMQKRIDYLKSVAVWSLPINLVLAALVFFFADVWSGVVMAFGAVYLSFATHVGAETAENVRKLDYKIERMWDDVRAVKDGKFQARLAELEAENAELKAVAQMALDQRDQVAWSSQG